MQTVAFQRLSVVAKVGDVVIEMVDDDILFAKGTSPAVASTEAI